MTFAKEFTDFPAADMPTIPEGFIDKSWHNDSCPSFHHAALALTIFVDYAEPSMRESGDSERFSISEDERDDAGSRIGVMTLLKASNDWKDIVAVVTHRTEAFSAFRNSSRLILEKGLERIEYLGGSCQIDLITKKADQRKGIFALTIANSSEQGFDLQKFEAELFRWAMDEGHIERGMF